MKECIELVISKNRFFYLPKHLKIWLQPKYYYHYYFQGTSAWHSHHPNPPNAEVTETVELYLHSHQGLRDLI